MQRYFVAPKQFNGEEVVITGEDVKHISKVMRMKEEDRIICLDNQGFAGEYTIHAITEGEVLATLARPLAKSTELPLYVTVVSGLSKGDKFEQVLQKGTELGASSFSPYKAARSVVKWEDKKANKKLARYQKIVKEAAEQSERTLIPTVTEAKTFQEVLYLAESYDDAWLIYEETARADEHINLSERLSQLKMNQSLLIMVGPEGGVSQAEADQAMSAGFHPISLGPRILRTETAPQYVLSVLSYYFECMR
ncbi:16S rRNA (uracil(1498)-N(3))-methyltransferase [Salsuginibacillus kocurii]|uniref:16S rRNA (uracil(1498)-N(3))-methyltransferase n=1 Tax=Salsuginibacillus kocurii TaxID=427078 RepID=UPI00036EB430|nr:16S rRNA (uracil(1498)-N(3))-methyltransferase [Salsuginibacillus kocurii]